MQKATSSSKFNNDIVVFSDGSDIYNNIAMKYIRHSTGRFILAPSGSGKTHYVSRQRDLHLIDGDFLWDITGADYSGERWNYNTDDVMEINARSDIITLQAKKLGFWIVGSSNLFLRPDAIVLPDWETHVKYISLREEHNYDGGATSRDLENLKLHIAWIRETWANEVPIFSSIENAVNHLKTLDS